MSEVSLSHSKDERPVTLYKRGDAMRSSIIRTARDLIVTEGFEKMSVSSIAAHNGITRSLFYHYFSSKADVAEAVLDDVANEYLGKIREWNRKRVTGNIEKALDDIVDLLYSTLDESGLFHHRLLTAGNASLYISFMDKVADRISHYIQETTVKDFVKHHHLAILNVRETFYMMIVGLISYIRAHPDTEPAIVKQVVVQTLHLENYLSESNSSPVGDTEP
ncbi:MAG: TetR/AcrR family transcriptional regulator [Bifidobacteriaceae bacterium]|jgi:AcrR family transcriptional regulator|nr:TetR/AcrR family transcriptional regulator [Bifidobacteriaceae bacterium]MCI1979677.1 TetR/AcrR family transcriptional regulator [Bifidobacteriaceae bacterium]